MKLKKTLRNLPLRIWFTTISIMKRKSDLDELRDNINSGYASQREPAVGNAILKLLEESRQRDKGSLKRDLLIVLISALSLLVSLFAYLKMD